MKFEILAVSFLLQPNPAKHLNNPGTSATQLINLLKMTLKTAIWYTNSARYTDIADTETTDGLSNTTSIHKFIPTYTGQYITSTKPLPEGKSYVQNTKMEVHK